ncbi:MAG: M15 family metallopeptidase [Gammaproteobacteria bacterium]|nr:M15 family metallopeptidase [Gammaproteobacteria bacterium]
MDNTFAQQFEHWSDSSRLLYGLENSYIVEHTLSDQTIRLHKDVIAQLEKLMSDLSKVGLTIRILSHWRSFEYQLGIWLKKWNGQATILDRNSKPLNPADLSIDDKISSLFFWSALPGLSRHHWGTDFDIFLAEPINNNYCVELIPQEFKTGGICEHLNNWLDSNLAQYQFYRPYDRDRGGVSPEPWHISFKPIAQTLQKKISAAEAADVIMGSEIPEKRKLLKLIPDYIKQYVNNVAG